ncbi:MAG TPA: TetR/AcrR family transcriptional regulator [Polyangia bacterium]|nr:TetR/AcrR family transcriptional regulator [Polyangia bacterium]
MSPAVNKDAAARGSRERILDGAAEEFAGAGFAGARIDRIARRTRLNVRMIYYHFGSKKGLYRAVLENIYVEMSRVIEALPPSAPNRTIEAFGAYIDLLTDHPRFADVLVRELLDGAKHLKALWKERPGLFKQLHLHARSIVEEGVKAGELRALDPALTVMTTTSIICFLTAARHSHALFLDAKRTGDRDAWKAHLQTLLLDGIRAR